MVCGTADYRAFRGPFSTTLWRSLAGPPGHRVRQAGTELPSLPPQPREAVAACRRSPRVRAARRRLISPARCRRNDDHQLPEGRDKRFPPGGDKRRRRPPRGTSTHRHHAFTSSRAALPSFPPKTNSAGSIRLDHPDGWAACCRQSRHRHAGPCGLDAGCCVSRYVNNGILDC